MMAFVDRTSSTGVNKRTTMISTARKNSCSNNNSTNQSTQRATTGGSPLSTTATTILRLSVICNGILLLLVGILLSQQQQYLASYSMQPSSSSMMKGSNMIRQPPQRLLNNRTFIGDISNTLPENMIHRDYIFHGGHPISSELRGSCYCAEIDMYCMCNPSIAIDIVIISGQDHLWFVRRKDTSQLAIVGGFVDIGETIVDAVYRELYEETGLIIHHATTTSSSTGTQQQQQQQLFHSTEPVLFGIYSDPRRDNRRHTVSAAFAIHLDGTEQPIASDDVKNVERIHVSKISELILFADQKTIVQDYLRLYYDAKKKTSADFITSYDDFAPDIHRSICVPFNVA